MEAAAAGNRMMLPAWTDDQWQDPQTLCEYIWGLRDNPFLQQIMLEKVAAEARKRHMTGFKGTYKAYERTQKGLSNDAATHNVTSFEGQPMELDCGKYQADDYAITIEGPYGEQTVCTHPILPVKRMVNLDTGLVMIELAFRRGMKGAWRRLIAEKQTLSTAQKIVALSDQGVSVTSENARALVSYLSTVEDLNYDKIPEGKSVGHLGWVKGGGFAPYVPGLSFDGDAGYKHAFEAIHEKGSWTAWKEAAQALRHGSSMAARLMLAAGFASLLVAPMDALPFVLHVWGGTSAGKTVGLMFCASIYGSPLMSDYVRSFNATAVANELLAAFYGALPVLVDEIQIIKERKDFDNIIYTFTEGAGKSRGAKAGGVQQQRSWRNCMISTGEQPILSYQSGGGAVNRVIEVDVKDEKLFPDPRGVLALIRENYGHAGKRFVDALNRPGTLDMAKTYMDAMLKELLEGGATDKQALSAALILTADMLSDTFLFDGEGLLLTAKDIAPFLADRAATDLNKRAYAWVCDFVATHPNQFEPQADGTYKGECWGKIDVSGAALIIHSVLKKAMEQEGYSFESFKSWGRREGVITPGWGGKNIGRVRLPIPQTYANCMRILLDHGEDEGEFANEDTENPFSVLPGGGCATSCATTAQQMRIPRNP